MFGSHIFQLRYFLSAGEENMNMSPSFEETVSTEGDLETQDIKPREIDFVDTDHFVTIDKETFAGTHLLLDLWEAVGLDDPNHIKNALHDAVAVSGASLLHLHLHQFTPSGGISGVAVLAESHISVHTWPERGYAAFDLFMCGDTQPELAVPILQCAFSAGRAEVTNIRRGKIA